MGHERWFRGQHDGQGRAFDWRAAARQRGVPEQLARGLYERAVREARGATQVEETYLALLGEAHPGASRPSPGKVTRTMRSEAERAHRNQRSAPRTRAGRRSAAPAKVTLTSYLAPRTPAFHDRPSEIDAERTHLEATHAARQRPSENTRHVTDELERTLEALLGTGTPMSPEPWADIESAEKAWAGEAPWTAEEAAPTPAPVPESFPGALRARMERAFGQRFDQVRIHRDSLVPAGRQAFTRGHDIYIGPDELDLESPEGERILAHELAHVAQQARPTISWEPRPTIADLEADAHQASLQALAGQAAAVHLAAPAGLALNYTDDPGPVDGNAQRRAPRGTPGGAAPDGAPAARARTPAARPGSEPLAARGPGAGQAPGREPGAGRGAGTAPAGVRPGASPGGPAAGPATGASGSAGNARGASGSSAGSPAGGGSDLVLREAPDTLSAPAQARLGQIDGNIQGAAERVNELPAADASTTAARGAAEEPQAEQDANAQAGVAREIDDRPPPSPEIEAACERIREVIKSKRPPDEESLVDARPREMADQAGSEMNSGIESRADSVREGYADMENAPPGQPSREPVPVELPPEQVDIPEIDAASGVPDELSSEDVSLEADLSAQRQRIEDAGMTSEAAELVQDGPIADARTGLGDLETMAAADPAQVLADQSAAIERAAGDMQALQAAAEQALAQARSGTVGTLGTRSGEITGSEEQQRAEAGRRMQAIFDRARTDVDGLLQPLSGAALGRWDAGVDRLASDFESSLASVKQRIEERYQTEDDWDPFDEIGSLATQAWDYVAGLPDWVVEEYDRAEQLFADGCTSLITDISRDVNAVIEDCQAIIQQARDDIDEIVTSLPEELQAWAQGEAARLGTELDALESQVTDTQQGLNQDLIDRSNAAVQEVRERVHELREAAKGVVGRIADAVNEFLDDPARFLINGLLRVLGIPPSNFWALVDQLGNVIEGIADDPMGFANNLMAGVGQGFQQFFGNFPVHIGQGLFAWLFSRMGEAGVTMPRDFSIPSIVSLVLDVMGINWQRVRMLLARHIGEQNVAHIEQAYGIITTFIAQGPLGLVELLREQLDPGSIVDMIREAAIRYLMESIVTRVAARILMMLNPAGAILQAIEAIYRVLTWIYENAARIFTLIEAVVNGAAQVLAGNVGGLAALVEHALVGLMVPVIDFLADYLGLGGIPAAIRDLVLGLQQRVEQILDRVIGFIAEKARTLLATMTGRGADAQTDDTEESPVPKSLVEPQPAQVANLTPELVNALAGVPSGAVLHQSGEADPKQVTKNLLATHRDARFDRASGQLTLPAVSAGALEGARSPAELGQAIARETGVSKVTLQKRGAEIDLVGHINPHTAVGKLKPQDLKPGAGKKILLLGEANFSFARSLAGQLKGGQGIVASSYEGGDEIKKKYTSAASNIQGAEENGVKIVHGVDARNIDPNLGGEPPAFQYIVFNFPFVAGDRPTAAARNRAMLADFLKSAAPALEPGGRIYVTTKEYWLNRFHLTEAAQSAGLRWVNPTSLPDHGNDEGTVLEGKTGLGFDASEFPGYEHRETHADESAEGTAQGITLIFGK